MSVSVMNIKAKFLWKLQTNQIQHHIERKNIYHGYLEITSGAA